MASDGSSNDREGVAQRRERKREREREKMARADTAPVRYETGRNVRYVW